MQDQRYFCSQCHFIGGVSEFDFDVSQNLWSTMQCQACFKRTALLCCSGCRRMRFEQMEKFMAGDIIQCICGLQMCTLECSLCKQMNLVCSHDLKSGQIVINCSGCQRKQSKTRCPWCDKDLVKHTNDSVWSCNVCLKEFYIQLCPECKKEATMDKEFNLVCRANKSHQFKMYPCGCCRTYNSVKQGQNKFTCTACKKDNSLASCVRCQSKMFFLFSIGRQRLEIQCTTCKEDMLYFDCKQMLCPGVHIIGRTWFTKVQEKGQGIAFFQPVLCSNQSCTSSVIVAVCPQKQCGNITYYDAEVGKRCGKCDNPYQEQKTQAVTQECSICLVQPSNAILMDCGHVPACFECWKEGMSKGFTQCPICKKSCTKYTKLYI